MNQVQNDEIDFFEFFETLWGGKWLISTFVATAVLLGYGFLLSRDVVYESKLIYFVDTIPPFYDQAKVSTDFHKKFYSAKVFERWKQNNINTSLVFEDFSATEVVDGFVLSRDENKKLATLVPTRRERHPFVLVKSNQLLMLDDFFKYATHINGLLKGEYVVRAKDELKIINARFKDLGAADSSIVETVLSIDRYIVTAEKGANVLSIQRPSIPKKVSAKSSLILTMFVLLGGMIGVSFIFVLNAIGKRKEQLDKA